MATIKNTEGALVTAVAPTQRQTALEVQQNTLKKRNRLNARIEIASHYAVPGFTVRGSSTVAASGVPRWVSPRVMLQRSSMRSAPYMFDAYLMRTLSRSQHVSEILSLAQCAVAKQTLQELQKVRARHGGVTAAQLTPAVQSYVYGGAGTMDSLFSDVYRMLLGRYDMLDVAKIHTRTYTLLTTMKRLPAFIDLKEAIDGDTANAAAGAALLIRQMFTDAPQDNGAATTAQDRQALTSYMAGGVTPDDANAQPTDDLVSSNDANVTQSNKPAPAVPYSGVQCVSRACSNVHTTLMGSIASANGVDENGNVIVKQKAQGKNVGDTTDADGEEADEDDGTNGAGSGRGNEEAVNQVDPARIPEILQLVEHTLRVAPLNGGCVNGNGKIDSARSSMQSMPNRLRVLYQAFGRVDANVSQAVTMSKYGENDSMEVTTGGDVANMLPSEMLNLACPALRVMFYARVAEHGLLQRHRVGNDDAGRGSVIICLDVSSSMGTFNSVHASDKCVLASAFAMSLAKFAIAEGRSVLIAPFNETVQWPYVFVCNTKTRHNQRMLKQSLEAACALEPNGGTSFSNVFSALPDMFKLLADDGENADAVFITDGMGGAGHFGWRHRCPDGARAFALCIADNEYKVSSTREANRPYFDAVAACTANTLEQGIVELWERIVRQSFMRQHSDDAV